MKLYELTGNFAELFDRFDEIDNYTPDTDAAGRYVDDSGNVIEDLNAYREAYRQAWFETLSALEEDASSPQPAANITQNTARRAAAISFNFI